jgi:hypothetical protein
MRVSDANFVPGRDATTVPRDAKPAAPVATDTGSALDRFFAFADNILSR